jgi:LacI family transcriptional regulator
MADIARLAGVSVTTVSHVVNGTRPVSEARSQAVRDAIAKMGYVPDNVVRSMRTTGTRVVGVAMSAMTNPHFGTVLHGIEQAASRAGYSLMLTETHDERHGEMRAVAELLNRHVEAVILAPTAHAEAAIEHARRRQVPIVLLDRALPGLEVDQIVGENVEPTAELVDHLAAIGHRRIGMVTGRSGLTTTSERVEGFKQGLRRNGLRVRTAHIVSGESSAEGAHLAVLDLMRQGQPPTALVVGNNSMTIGTVRAARELRMSVPGDLAIVSFDDFEWADLFDPRLTVMAQPTEAMGEQAFELVRTRLENPGTPPRTVVLKPRLIHRDSCGHHDWPDSPSQ